MQVPPADRRGTPPATINHALAVVKMFYLDRVAAGQGPIVNPIPDAEHRASRRVHAHPNPMQPFRPGGRRCARWWS